MHMCAPQQSRGMRAEGSETHWPSAQQVASGSGQHAHVKQNPKNSRRQQHVLPAHDTNDLVSS